MKSKKEIYRILDANINRAKEGLRVCEEIIRFIIADKKISKEYKEIRHKLTEVVNSLFAKELLLNSRDIINDIGKDIHTKELKRENIKDIFFANLQRCKESVRVLEEFSKLINKKSAISFKYLRYKIYELEKRSFKKIFALYNH